MNENVERKERILETKEFVWSVTSTYCGKTQRQMMRHSTVLWTMFGLARLNSKRGYMYKDRGAKGIEIYIFIGVIVYPPEIML